MRFVVFPSFTPTQLQQLQQLYRNRPNPTEGVIAFWATRLKADGGEVAEWIQYQQEKAKESPAPAAPFAGVSDRTPSLSPTDPFSRTHLPTPAKSPSPNHQSPGARNPSLPPVAVKVEDQGQQYSPSPVATWGPVMSYPEERLTSAAPITRRPELVSGVP